MNNGKIYLIPVGLGTLKDTKKVISIDKKDLSVEEYPFNYIGLIDSSSIGDFVYAVNNLNGENHLVSYNTKTKKHKTVTLKGGFMYTLIPLEDRLVAIYDKDDATPPTKHALKLQVYTQDLKLLFEKDINEYGEPSGKYYQDDHDLYLTLVCDKFDKYIGKLLKINKDSFDMQVFNLKEKHPFDIYRYKDKFIITHFNPVDSTGTQLSIWSPNGEEKMVDLGMPLDLTGMLGDQFIVADQQYLRSYSLDDFKMIKEYKIPLEDGFYTSQLIFVD